MTGDEATLRNVGLQFGVDFAVEDITDHEHPDGTDPDHEHDDYLVGHTSPSYLIDSEGYWRMMYFYGADTDAMAASIQEILDTPVN